MSKPTYFLRYRCILNCLRSRCRATFEEISDYLGRESDILSYDLNISKRTFQRDLNEIRSIFDIDIKCDSNKNYFITENESTEINERMLEALDIFNSLNISSSLAKYIHFETRSALGTQHLPGMIHAIKNRQLIGVLYKKFWENESSIRIVEPYALKESLGRWYLLAKDLKDNRIKTFGLDRVQFLNIENKKFTYPKGLNIHEMFRHCFGIINPENKNPEEVVLSFNPEQGKYILTYPLHSSQEILKSNSAEVRIKLKIIPTFDFIMEMLSHGPFVKVIQPAKLRNEIRNLLSKALKQY